MGRNRRKQHSETTAKIGSLHLLNRSYATAHTDNVGADSGSISQGLDMAALATKILFSSVPFFSPCYKFSVGAFDWSNLHQVLLLKERKEWEKVPGSFDF